MAVKIKYKDVADYFEKSPTTIQERSKILLNGRFKNFPELMKVVNYYQMKDRRL